MPNLEVPGATLHYETFGSGPLLLLIPGANGRGSIFHDVAKQLSTKYKVICWDRRGYSQSHLHGAQDFNNRLFTDADDAALLIKHLTPKNASSPTATVFGTSSGAIVAQTLLLRHPETVTLLLAHEPPCFTVLPEQYRAQGAGLVNHIYDIYRSSGPIAAMDAFTAGLSEGEDGAMMRASMNPSRGDEIRANALFWFEFELRQYPLADVDVEGLVGLKGKYVPLAGTDSGEGPGVGPVSVIARAVGKDVARVPGGHVGYMTHAEEWAKALLRLLETINT